MRSNEFIEMYGFRARSMEPWELGKLVSPRSLNKATELAELIEKLRKE